MVNGTLYVNTPSLDPFSNREPISLHNTATDWIRLAPCTGWHCPSGDTSHSRIGV